MRDPMTTLGSPLAATVDLDDMFGIRRALRTLPEHRWDDFFSAWAEIADRCALDVERMQVEIAGAVRAPRDNRAGFDDSLAPAWATVSEAMRCYLAWRARRGAPRSP